MLKSYFKLVFIPLASMAAGLAMFCFMLFWVQHECYNEYLGSADKVVVSQCDHA